MFWLADVFNGNFSPEEMRRREQWAHQQRAETIHRTFSAAGRGAGSLIGGAGRAAGYVAAGLATLYRKQRRWQRRRAAIRELRSLSDRTLRDIGVPRSEIRNVVEEMLDGKARDRSRSRTSGHRLESVPVSGSVDDQRKPTDEWRRAA